MGQVGSWDARVVASLRVSKRAGCTFDQAWKIATGENPPRARELFVPDDGTADLGGRLFNEDGVQDESIADALYRFCWDAWHGKRPTLRHFTLDMLRDEPGSDRLNHGLERWAA